MNPAVLICRIISVGLLSGGFGVGVKRVLEVATQAVVVDHDPFWAHEVRTSEAPEVVEVLHTPLHSVGVEGSDVEDGNDVAAARRPAGGVLVIEGPPLGVEQGEATFPLGQAVATLDARAPPFTEVAARTELQEFNPVAHDPVVESEVVEALREEAVTGACKEVPVFGDQDLAVGAVDLFRDRDVPHEARDLGEGFKGWCWDAVDHSVR